MKIITKYDIIITNKEVITVGLRLRKTLGTKHIKANISKKGYISTSIKIAK